MSKPPTKEKSLHILFDGVEVYWSVFVLIFCLFMSLQVARKIRMIVMKVKRVAVIMIRTMRI